MQTKDQGNTIDPGHEKTCKKLRKIELILIVVGLLLSFTVILATIADINFKRKVINGH